MHRQEFPFSFIRKKSTVEGLPSAVLSMDAAQERVSPRTGYPTIFGGVSCPLRLVDTAAGILQPYFFKIFNFFLGLDRIQSCFPGERIKESSVHGFQAPAIHEKRSRTERVSQIKWSCVHFRDFSRRRVKDFRFKKLTQLLQNNPFVFFHIMI